MTMNDGSKLCDRCGGRLGTKTVQIDITRTVGDKVETKSSIDACEVCGKSLVRWLDRGPRPSPDRNKKRKKEPRQEGKRTSKRQKFRVKREHIALAIVIILSAMFCLYISRPVPAG
jgi:hypothetical protein